MVSEGREEKKRRLTQSNGIFISMNIEEFCWVKLLNGGKGLIEAHT